MTVGQYLRINIRVAQCTHPVDVDQCGHDSSYQTSADQRAAQPVVVFSVNADKDNGEQNECPQQGTGPVYSVQGHFLGHAEGACQEEHTEPDHNQQTDDQPVHVLPVGPVTQMSGYQSRELDAFEYDDVDHRIEYGEVSRRSYAQTDV